MVSSSLSKHYTLIQYPQMMMSFVMVYLLISFTSCMFRDYYYKVVRIKQLIVIHNVLSILFSMYMFVGILHHTRRQNYTWVGNEIDDLDTTLAHYVWVFHLTKYYECMDTFIMILRKSYRQITLLHVYHHASMIMFTWTVLYAHPGGDFYLGPLLNSFVHIWSYLYYLCVGFMNKQNKVKYLWWSKYLTQLQIIQFFINLFHSVYAMKNTTHDRYVFQIGLFHQLSFIVLFGKFYLDKYKKKLKFIHLN
jgi:hypothetical protein